VGAAIKVFALVAVLILGKEFIGYGRGLEGELRIDRAGIDQERCLGGRDVFLVKFISVIGRRFPEIK